MFRHPPQKLQSTLWSVAIKNLDISKNSVYIINQVLAYGSIDDWRWLFKTYPLKVIKDVFLNKPVKTYPPERYNFVKNILLEIKNKKLIKEFYVVNTPRIIK